MTNIYSSTLKTRLVDHSNLREGTTSSTLEFSINRSIGYRVKVAPLKFKW